MRIGVGRVVLANSGADLLELACGHNLQVMGLAGSGTSTTTVHDGRLRAIHLLTRWRDQRRRDLDRQVVHAKG